MRDIVATIQGEQDEVIRAPLEQVLIVQGGPGTGKTAVALHRAAFLLFEHRQRLGREGMLVVGPNQAFLDYIANVLPSLGERSVRQTTVADLCLPRVEVTASDPDDVARWKGSADRLVDLERAAMAAIRVPDEDIRVPLGSRVHVIARDLFAGWLETAKSGTSPINERRERVRAQARRELLRRTGSDDAWSRATVLKQAITKAWPSQKPVTLVDRILPGPSGRRRAWTPADQLLVDEANSILNGTPFTYGHVIVDEAQDHSAVALRVIGRRAGGGSLTLVGDVAQSTAPAGQEGWSSVFDHLATRRTGRGSVRDLTIGYRVPEPILAVANRLLPRTGVEASPSRSVRATGSAPAVHRASPGNVAAVAARAIREVKAHHRLTGAVAPERWHDALAQALSEHTLRATDHVHELAADEVPVFTPETVKGLEFDGVVVVAPEEILAEGDAAAHTPRGARLLYVAMTRAVQRLDLVTCGSLDDLL